MKNKLTPQFGLLMLFILGVNTSLLNAQTDSAYFYLGGIQQMFYQQPDVYSFKKSDNSEYSVVLSSTVVEKKEYKSDGMNYIFFKPTATLSDIQAIISSVSTDPMFEKEFMVLTQDWNTDFTAKDYLGTDIQIEVVFNNPNITHSEVVTFAQAHNLSIFFESQLAGGVYVFDVNPYDVAGSYLDPKLSVKRAAQIWEQSTLVSKVQPSLRMFVPNSDPNDPLYPNMWHYENNGNITCNGGAGTAGADAKIDRAWNLDNQFGYGPSYSGQGVVVGVIDFHGFQYTHPDLQGQLLPGFNTISGSNSGNFSTDLILDNTKAHGNNVAGIIASKLNNEIGVAGVAYNSKIYPIIIAGTTGQISIAFDKCMNYDGNNTSVDVINMSWGDETNRTIAFVQQQAFYTNLEICFSQGRNNKGIPLINSAGNKNLEISQSPSVLTEVFSVGATNPNDQRKLNGDGFGNYDGGGTCYWSDLDVSAPGVCLLSTDYVDSIGYSTSDYYAFGGTSGAAPIVSGIVALLLEKEPNIDVADIYQAIRDGAEKVGGYTYDANGRTLQLGSGRVNAYNVVYQIVAPIKNIQEIDFSITNPINSELTINLEDIENYNIKIFDALGKLLLETSLTDDNSIINLETFSNGIYFLNVIDNKSQNTTSKKFIKL